MARLMRYGFQISLDMIYLLSGAPSPFEPPHRFVPDEHTLAFWDFNDKEGVDRFEDESGNGETLIGMNGAITIGGTGVNLERDLEDGLEIRPNNSLATTWGKVKSEAF